MVKTITVRVVEWISSDERTDLGEQTLEITAEGGVEAAVRETYSVFPNNCQRVLLVRARPVLLWSKGVGAWVYSRADAYALVQEGEVVEVQKRVSVVGSDTPFRQ
jgi:hypothetical protein